MATIDILKSNLRSLENNLGIYEQEIDGLTERIREVVDTLKSDNIELNSPVWDKILAYSSLDFSKLEKSLLDVSKINVSDEIIDYSVKGSDLTLKENFSINGKTISIYKSSKTDALYVITNGLNQKERNQLNGELKNHLSSDQMAIVTYNGDYFKYDVLNKNNCTVNYDVVGKDENGKMYAFRWRNDSHVNVDDGGKDRTLLTSINGMILADNMDLVMETNTNIHLKVRAKRNILGGQTVEEFVRLAFTPGDKSVSVKMDGDWQKYANTVENKRNGTWVSNWSGGGEGKPNHRAVAVGNGPTKKYDYTWETVGYVDSDVIPITISSTDKAGGQVLNGSVNYHFSGDRTKNDKDHPNSTSKDFLAYHQSTVLNWL